MGKALLFETLTEDSLAKIQFDDHLLQIGNWTAIPEELADQFPFSDLDSAQSIICPELYP